MIERVEPFAPGRTGRSNVVVAKDRPGAVRRHAQSTKDKQVIGVLQVSSDRDGVTTVTLASGGRDEATATSVSRKMEEILDAMGTGSFRRMGDIKDLVKGGAQTKTDALRQLILEGKVSDSSPYTRQS